MNPCRSLLASSSSSNNPFFFDEKWLAEKRAKFDAKDGGSYYSQEEEDTKKARVFSIFFFRMKGSFSCKGCHVGAIIIISSFQRRTKEKANNKSNIRHHKKNHNILTQLFIKEK